MAHRSQSGLSAAAVIDIWEQGAGRHLLDRALLLLRYTCPRRAVRNPMRVDDGGAR
ncbi:MAG: hypothetical protein IPK92_01745 [Nitrospira sp.]|nr:hypothetical protein [Nitrospira sp.]